MATGYVPENDPLLERILWQLSISDLPMVHRRTFDNQRLYWYGSATDIYKECRNSVAEPYQYNNWLSNLRPKDKEKSEIGKWPRGMCQNWSTSGTHLVVVVDFRLLLGFQTKI